MITISIFVRTISIIVIETWEWFNEVATDEKREKKRKKNVRSYRENILLWDKKRLSIAAQNQKRNELA